MHARGNYCSPEKILKPLPQDSVQRSVAVWNLRSQHRGRYQEKGGGLSESKPTSVYSPAWSNVTNDIVAAWAPLMASTL